jgi:alkaline phosphatase D
MNPHPPLYPISETRLPRRTFIAGAASFAAAVCMAAQGCGTRISQPKLASYPFTLGVASGDPDSESVVLWTRLAPRPLEVGGGMPAEAVLVRWEVAKDDGFRRIAARGDATADPAWGHSVHVEVKGLETEQWYWYRFFVGNEASPIGRTRTLPRGDVLPGRFRFAFASCQRFESGYFTAFDHLAREEIDLVLHLGDYIYEGDTRPNDIPARGFAAVETVSLDDYRRRYAVYKRDPALQAAHAAAPWVVTWDDHEVSNDYAGDRSEHPDRFPRAEFLRRRAAAYQAFFEHQPLRRAALPTGPDMLLYRRVNFGRLLTFHVLDTRQYRTVQPQGGGIKPASPVLLDEQGTILGAAQRQWVSDGLQRSAATWNAVAQQVLFARVDRAVGPEIAYSMDKWAGYERDRRRLLRHFHAAKIRNPVVLTGDIHNNWANELIADFDELDSASVATEFVGTSISSGGDGGEKTASSDSMLTENPFVKFFNNERGYVRCEITPHEWRTDYRTIPYVSRPGAPILTRASFRVASGRPTLERV